MNNIQQQYPADIGPHFCNLCPEKFAVSSGLLVHKLTSHSCSIAGLLVDLLEHEVLNSSDEEYCYSFVFTTTYYRNPNTGIKTEPIREEDPCEIQDAMYFEVDPLESKPIIEDLQRSASSESTIMATSSKATHKRMRKMCPICYRRFHPQGLYRHIEKIHNTKYSISKGRAMLVRRTIDCGAEKPAVPLEDVPFLPETKNETQLKQTPKRIANDMISKMCLICGDRFHPQGLYRHMFTKHNIKYSVRVGRQPSIYIDVTHTELKNEDEISTDPLDKGLPEEIAKRPTSHKIRKMCPICYRRFHPQGLYRHLKVMHNTIYSTASVRSRTKTLNECNVESSVIGCDVADTVETKPEVVETDALEHVSKENIKRSHKISKMCPLCFAHFHPKGLYRHLLIVHKTRYSEAKGKINLKQTKAEETSTEKTKILQTNRKCPFCNRFYHTHGLSRHLQNAHGKSKVEIAAMYKRIRAQPLPPPHATSIEHQSVVDAKPPFLCPMCDEKFECQNSIRQHLRQIHQFPISTTDKLIYPKQARRILTSNLRPCPLCECGLHPQSITRHLRSVHKSGKEEVLALSRLMRVEQKRREVLIRKSR